jgi:hypothetical protein
MPNVMVAAAVPARMYPSPAAHSIVCCVDAAKIVVTVSTRMLSEVVAAVAAPPPVTVHTGTLPVTKIAELAVMVTVSAASPAPAVPALRTPSEDGVKMNLCLMGAMFSVSWLYDVAEPQTTAVAARVVYEEPAVADVVSVVVTTVKATAPAAGLTARAPSPVVHVNVVDAAAMAPVTVSTRMRSDVVAAVTVPAVLPHAGTLLVV